MSATVTTIDHKVEDRQFNAWKDKCLVHNERNSPLTDNELVFLRKRFKEGKKYNEVVI